MNTTVNDSTAGEDKANLKRGQNCVPVMIAHLVRYGEKLTVWGTPVRLITFVGLVHKIEPTSTKVSFEFSDDTGNSIFCSIYLYTFSELHCALTDRLDLKGTYRE